MLPFLIAGSMIKDISFSVAFGIASTLFLSLSLFEGGGSATTANAFQTMSLMTLSIIPLFLSGLGWGLTGGIISVAAGAVLSGILIGPLFGLTYVVTCGLPVLVIVRQALLWREEDGKISWYPTAHLMVCWSVICIVLSGIAVYMLYLDDNLRNELIRQFDVLIPQVKKQGGVFATVTAEKLVRLMPQFFGPLWGIIILTSGCLAQGVLVHFKKNIRPTPEFSGVQMPKWLAALTIGVIILSMFMDGPGVIMDAVVITLEIVFFLQGMAVIHKVSRSWTYRPLVLVAIYLIMVLMFWPVLVITLLGLADSWIGFRDRVSTAPNQKED